MIQVEQVRLLYDQANTGLVVTIVVSLILGTFLITEEAEVATIGIWWLGTVLVAAWRWRLTLQFHSDQDANSNISLWYRRFVLGATLAGLTWGIGGAAAAFEVSILNQTLILAVIATMVAGAIIFLGSVVAAYVGYMLGAALPLLVWMLWQWDYIHTIIAILTLVFIAAAWSAVLRFSGLLSKTLYLNSKSSTLAEELRTTDERLQNRDSMLAEAARTVMLGHWHFDKVTNEYLSVSDEYAHIFGYSAEAFLATFRSFDEDMNLMFPADRERVLKSYEMGEGAEIDYRIVRKDGKIRHVREISKHIHDETGKLVESRGILQDITDLKEAQHEAERATLAKSEFLSRMSHELRTPMNAVLGFSQLLEADKTLNEKQKIHVGHVLSAGNHLLALIDEVLDIERIDSGRIQLFMEPVDADKVLQECAHLIQPLAEEYCVTIESHVTPGSVPVVWADKLRLKQVLLNLLSNGVKYNRDGGRVAVSFEDREEGKLRISVSDTGKGIPEERKGELFEPYSRLGAEGSSIEGSGIGLTITKRLIELMGGQLGVETTQDNGCTFWVELGMDRYVELAAEPITGTDS